MLKIKKRNFNFLKLIKMIGYSVGLFQYAK